MLVAEALYAAVVPTHVGVNRTADRSKSSSASCPHARGGEPGLKQKTATTDGVKIAAVARPGALIRAAHYRNLDLDQLKYLVISIHEPEYRAKQIFSWLYKFGIENFLLMKNISEKLRMQLDEHFSARLPEVIERLESTDGTKKFLFKLEDNCTVESVLIPERERNTICISTQVGCKLNCAFCASGKMGFVRNLYLSEILGQILYIKFRENVKITNVVFMGMGEPFDNYDNLIKAIKIINSKDGCGLAARKITVSTAGIVPSIKRFADEIGIQVRLSVSLHGPDDETRSKIMPVNNKYPLESLLDACAYYIKKTGRRITFEYVLIEGVNCFQTHAEKLAQIAKKFSADINLIPFSKIEGVNFSPPEKDSIHRFFCVLKKYKVRATIRDSRGSDIKAACGQLAGKGRISL